MRVTEIKANPTFDRQAEIHIKTSDVSDVQALMDKYDQSKKYVVEIKQKRSKRSLDANAYSWVLTGKLADVLGIEKDECHRLMLAKYGQTAKDSEGTPIFLQMQAKIPFEAAQKHLGYIDTVKQMPGDFTVYRALKGSREFDSKEMSVFIDGIVADCEVLGIPTETPDEIERMKQLWGDQGS